MGTEPKEKIVLRWYHLRRVRFTGEYVGGLIAGFGGGLVVIGPATQCLGWPLVGFLGLAMIWIGASIALRAQDRHCEGVDESGQDKSLPLNPAAHLTPRR